LHLGNYFRNKVLIIFKFGEFAKLNQIGARFFELINKANIRFKLIFFAKQFLRFGGIVPQFVIRRKIVQLIKPNDSIVVVKETSSAG